MHKLSRTSFIAVALVLLTALSTRGAGLIIITPLIIRPLMDRESAEMAASVSATRVAGFDLARVNDALCTDFAKAWQVSRNGTTGEEGVVLVFRKIGGGYFGKSLGSTSERRKFTFKWAPNAIAIVHTHPNNAPAEPSEEDEQVAIKYGVPIFTITKTGMYVFDPFNKQTRKVMDGLDWLDPSKFVDLSLWRAASVARHTEGPQLDAH